MKITIENIGVFKYAEYELADLTIICGKNNTGKTYATYALYGFIDFFRRGYNIKVSNAYISTLFEKGTLSLPLDTSQSTIDKYVNGACKAFQKLLPKIFSAQEKYFEESHFCIKVSSDEISIPDKFEYGFRTNKKDFLQIQKAEDKNELFITLLLRDDEIDENSSVRVAVERIIGDVIKKVLFDSVFKECFIASAERTGAVIFKDELNFQKNNILREVAIADEIHIEDIVDKIYTTNYALPVRRNIDFIRNLESISKEEGLLYKSHPEIIEIFNSIVGGEYKVSKDGVYYLPSGSKSAKLTIGESASSVRSLLYIYFYLKYVAKPGHMLMIDEPELNLHPESQRNLARLIALLVNYGVRVYITTHSDYIIKEFNTLLMLNHRKENSRIKNLMIEKGYAEEGLLSPMKIKMFISEKANILLPGNKRKSRVQSLVPANITSEFGIEAISFDNTIEEMNNIQESIMFC